MFKENLIKITGKPNWPGGRYVFNKSIKYLFFVPPTLLRAKIRWHYGGKPDDKGKKYLFLGGLHRNGTSPLYKIIKSHPEISGMSYTTVPQDEGQHLQSVYKADSVYGMLFGFNNESHLTEESEIVTTENKEQLLREWGRFLNFSKNVFVEKSPSNIVRTRFLQALFPNSCFLNIMRHPVAVALAVRKWTMASLPDIVDHWAICHKILLNDMKHLNSAMLIRYEDFPINSDAILKNVYQTIGVQARTSKVKFVDMNEGYFSEWTRNRYWERDDIGRVQSKYHDFLQSFNYSLEPPYVL